MEVNVRDRRGEIGILRALGKSGSTIASLFLGKSILVGLIGGIGGCLLGFSFAFLVGWSVSLASDGVSQVAGSAYQPTILIILGTLVGAPLVAMVASVFPTMMAVQQDPAVVLQDQ